MDNNLLHSTIITIEDGPKCKWFLADYREDRSPSSKPWWCVHGGTVSWDNLKHSIYLLNRDGIEPVFAVFRAKNRTQVARYLSERGQRTNVISAHKPTPSPKEDFMITRRQQFIQKQIDRLQDELLRLQSLPDEPTNEPGVIYFVKTFGGDNQYTYAAVRADNGMWYTTGPSSPKSYTWEKLVQWMYDNEPEDFQVWVAGELTLLS